MLRVLGKLLNRLYSQSATNFEDVMADGEEDDEVPEMTTVVQRSRGGVAPCRHKFDELPKLKCGLLLAQLALQHVL